MVLSTGYQAQGRVDVHPTVGEVGGVIEKGSGDLAARSREVRLADQALEPLASETISIAVIGRAFW